jgi:hypothetical protein
MSLTIILLLVQTIVLLTSFCFSFRAIGKRWNNKGLGLLFFLSCHLVISEVVYYFIKTYMLGLHSNICVTKVARNILGILHLPYFGIIGFYIICYLKQSKEYFQLFFVSWLLLIISFLIIEFGTNFVIMPCLVRVGLLLLAMVFFREIATQTGERPLALIPSFWIVTGVAIYCIGTLPYDFIILFFKNPNSSFTTVVVNVSKLPLVIQNLFFIKAFLCIKKR